ncbi:MAG TPA: hypothetical protein VGL38_00620 [bacterium]|jgi:hypothetical protein
MLRFFGSAIAVLLLTASLAAQDSAKVRQAGQPALMRATHQSAARPAVVLPKTPPSELTLYNLFGVKIREITRDPFPRSESDVCYPWPGMVPGSRWIRLMPPFPGGRETLILRNSMQQNVYETGMNSLVWRTTRRNRP